MTDVSIASGTYNPTIGGTKRGIVSRLGERVSIKDFGAVGNGTADDTAALQAAITCSRRVFFPAGVYKITAPLEYIYGFYWEGEGGPNTGAAGGPPCAEITASFGPEPMIHPRDLWVNEHNEVISGADPAAYLGTYIVENLKFTCWHPLGQILHLRFAMAPSRVTGCSIGSGFRGLFIAGFDALVAKCNFYGLFFDQNPSQAVTPDWDLIGRSYALQQGGHTLVQACGFQGNGLAHVALGNENSILNCRYEVNAIGLQLGGIASGEEGAGQHVALLRGIAMGLSFESNLRSFIIDGISSSFAVSSFGIQGGTNAPSPSGKGEYGLWIKGVGSECSVSSGAIGGYFTKAVCRADAPVSLNRVSILNNLEAGKPAFQGTQGIFCSTSPGVVQYEYAALSAPNDPAFNAAGDYDQKTITAFANLQLRGIKGINATIPSVQPNNLGGIEPVTTSATSLAVAFATTGAFQLAQCNAVSDGTSVLPAGTYHYAAVSVYKNGEGGCSVVTGITHKTVTVTALQRVDVQVYGGHGAPFWRIYRGNAAGEWQGFWHLSDFAVFADRGQAFHFTGTGPLERDVGPHSSQEADANYAIVATPSWGTTCWITAKATTGFTLNFGTAAPSGATVQWLLFRP